MPDLGQLVLLVLTGVPLTVLVARPFRRRRAASSPTDEPDLEALALRRRIAYDALRDLDLDYRAHNLPLRQYLEMRADLELRAAETLAALEAAAGAIREDGAVVVDARRWRAGRRLTAGVALMLAVTLVVGFALPEPWSLANGTVVNQVLAAAQAAEKARLDEIERLQSKLRPGETPSRTVLSDLADAYLAGSSRDELARGALVLLALIQLEPENRDARARIITAYLRAGDYANATRATDAFETVAPESVDVAFFRGLIALRGTGDRIAAVEAFDEFLRTAPEDPRASMVRALRAEAAGELPPGS